MFNYGKQLYLALVLATTVRKSLAQDVVLVGGPYHSPGSTIRTTLSLKLTSGVSYNIAWKFDETIVCVIPIPFASIDNANCAGTTYYNKHSVVNATLSTSNDLEAEFTYRNAKEESKTISVSVQETNSGDVYGQTDLTVKGFAQVVLLGGPYHSPESTIQTNFSTTLTGLDSRSYQIVWKFNDTTVCYISIPAGKIDPAPYCSSPKDTTYYNNNSVVTSANLSSTGLLEVVFTYSNAREENNTINVTVFGINSGTIYGHTDLAVKACSTPANTAQGFDPASSPAYCGDNYNYYDCTVLFSCEDGYYGDNVMATCQANATWSNDISCLPETTTLAAITKSTDSAQTESTTTGTNTTRPAVLSTSDSESTSSSITDPESVGLSIGAAMAIGACIGIVVGVIATSAVWWWMTKRVNKKLDEKNEPAYEPTYVDSQGVEPAYDVINQETVHGFEGQVASQPHTNVNAAYEVIR